MKGHRVRFAEKIHEDGIMAIEVVVGGGDEDGRDTAIARATQCLGNAGFAMPWVEWVKKADE